jgi:single-strand DNA-binding protein
MSINRAIIAGFITRDVVTKKVKNGTMMSSFSVATTEKYKKADGSYQEFTDFHNIVSFNAGIVEQCEILKKGAMVYIEGRMKVSSWEKDGKINLAPQIEPNLVRVVALGKNSENIPDQQKVEDDGIPF